MISNHFWLLEKASKNLSLCSIAKTAQRPYRSFLQSWGVEGLSFQKIFQVGLAMVL